METVGFKALARHGQLGVVVDVERSADGGPTAIIVRGGVSEALTYYVPAEHVRHVSSASRRVHLDVDLADFVPYLNQDGTIELRAPSE